MNKENLYKQGKISVKNRDIKIKRLEKKRSELVKELIPLQKEIESEENYVIKERNALLKLEEEIWGNASEMSYEDTTGKEFSKRRQKKLRLQEEIKEMKEKRREKMEFLNLITPMLRGFNPLEQRVQQEADEYTRKIEELYEQIMMIYL